MGVGCYSMGVKASQIPGTGWGTLREGTKKLPDPPVPLAQSGATGGLFHGG